MVGVVTALVVRLLTGRFIWEYDPTLEAAYRHHTTVDDDTAVMDILDTAGQVNLNRLALMLYIYTITTTSQQVGYPK